MKLNDGEHNHFKWEDDKFIGNSKKKYYNQIVKNRNVSFRVNTAQDFK